MPRNFSCCETVLISNPGYGDGAMMQSIEEPGCLFQQSSETPAPALSRNGKCGPFVGIFAYVIQTYD